MHWYLDEIEQTPLKQPAPIRWITMDSMLNSSTLQERNASPPAPEPPTTNRDCMISIRPEWRKAIMDASVRSPIIQDVMMGINDEGYTMTNDGLFLYYGKIIVPENTIVNSTNPEQPGKYPLQKILIHKCHNILSHPSPQKIKEYLRRYYYWDDIHGMIMDYYTSYDTCQCTKPNTAKPRGEAHPLPPPTAPFQSISIDFF